MSEETPVSGLRTQGVDLHFDASYCEESELHDGTKVHLRLVRPEDKPLFVEGFQRLSPQSRYRRFFAAKKELTAADLTYLTEFDGWNHLAIAGSRRREDGSEEGLGVARFVRLKEDPTAAEAAVAVIDDYQSRGLGTLLLLRLVAAARERGINRFRSTVLTGNAPIFQLLQEAGARIVGQDSAGVMTVEASLPDVTARASAAERAQLGALQRLLAAVAAGFAWVRERYEPDATARTDASSSA